MAAHLCGGCGHARGVHAISLGRCLGAPDDLFPCGCARFWWQDEPEGAPAPGPPSASEPDDAEDSWWARQRSPYDNCGGCGG
ncbi:hypothetical protein [Streptomyces sp. NPDC050504]|uniref:hypothetical protein n=1 Tax=Streptomyces sp. NPDC050504 TaxID=3365618 RepID=UPI0037BCBC01